jgi:TrmH family RNA methyltransferase
MPREITSFSNDTVKRIRGLRDKKVRRMERMFLAEGLRILAEARDSGFLPHVIAYAGGQPLHPLATEIVAEAEAQGADVIETTPDILSKMSGKDNPQAILGVYRQPDASLASLDRDASPLWLVAQSMRDPGNIGTVLRTGDAVGAGGLILLDESADPFSVEAVRASMGALFTQQVAIATWDAFLPWLRAAPGQLIGTSLNTDNDYLDATYAQPCFLLVGNESQGLPAAYEAECDLLVKMPMLGRADSLNAAVATAVMAYQIRAGWRNR